MLSEVGFEIRFSKFFEASKHRNAHRFFPECKIVYILVGILKLDQFCLGNFQFWQNSFFENL